MDRLSIRVKISLSLVVIILLVVPVVEFSLFYFTGMRRALDQITEVDVKMAQIAEEVSFNMLLARRAERSYVLLGDSLYVSQHRERMEAIWKRMAQGQRISKGDRALLDEMLTEVERYEKAFDSLTSLIRGQTHLDERRLRRRVSQAVGEFIQTYSTLFARAQAESSAVVRDSLITAADRYAASFSMDTILNQIRKEENPQQEIIQDQLDESSRRITEIAEAIARRNRRMMELHRRETLQMSARAVRNIIAALMVTALIGLYMVIVLPRRIVRPITQITQRVRRIQTGDLTVSVSRPTRDEIGELTDLLNRMVREFRMFDELKTQKIAAQQQRLQMLADRIGGVLIVDPEDGRVSVVSLDMQRAFGWRDLVDHVLSEADAEGRLWSVVKESVRGGESDVKHLVEIRTRGMEARRVQVKVQLVKDRERVTGVLLFMRAVDH